MAHVYSDRVNLSEWRDGNPQYLSTTPTLLSSIHTEPHCERNEYLRTRQPWEPISGQDPLRTTSPAEHEADSPLGVASFENATNRTVTLYISTHLSHMAGIQISTEVDSQGSFKCDTKRADDSALMQTLQNFLEHEDRRRNFGGLAVLKTWGLATLPNYDVVAACVSVHGGDMPEYSLPSKERSTVLFASGGGQEMFPWQDVAPPVKDVSVVQKDILKKISRYDSVDTQVDSAFSRRIVQAASVARKLLALEEDNGKHVIPALEEHCSICSQEIPSEGLIEAACPRGHQFGKSATI